MRLFFRLLKTQLNQRFGISAMRASFRTHRLRAVGQLLLVLIVLLSIGALVGMYAWLMTKLVPVFVQLGMQHVMLGIILLASMVVVFFMGLVYLIGMLFFSKDTEFLASLPIPQRTVFAAKFVQVLLGEVSTSLVLLLPPFIIYGVQMGEGAGYWLRMAVISLAAPCIPLALAALLSLLLMRLSALWRRRELLTIIGSLLLVLCVLLGQAFLTSWMPQDLTAEMATSMITGQSALLRGISSAFPPSDWAASALLGQTAYMALFLGVSAVSLALVIWAAGRLYYRGALAQLESSSERRRIPLDRLRSREHRPMVALFLREWRVVLRSPTYALNGLIGVVMGPVLLVMFLVMQGIGDPELDAILSLLLGAMGQEWLMIGLAAVGLFVATINPALFTSLSREGAAYPVLRMLPVTGTKIVLAKYLFGYSIALLTVALTAVAGVFVLPIPPLLILGAFGLGAVVIIAPLALSLLPDILRPKLAWSSETEAIKQNANGILGMLISMAYLVAAGFGCYFAIRHGGVPVQTLVWLLPAVSAVLGGLTLWLLAAVGRRSIARIEG